MSKTITCFKAYDARGKVPSELNDSPPTPVVLPEADVARP